MSKRIQISIVILVLAGLTVYTSYAASTSREAHLRAIEASRLAAEAAQEAAKAKQAVDQAARAAQEAAKQAEELAYQAYLAMMADARAEHLTRTPLPPEPPELLRELDNPIDAFIAAKWPEATDPPICGDSAFIRRVFLDVVGHVPSAAEVRVFLDDDSPDKRARLIDELLQRDEDYAVHWSQFWEDALCSNGNHQGGIGTRANFQQFIIESFNENKPYDVFTAQLLDPTATRYRGGYVRAQTHQDSVLTAANVGQVFLGTRMKCASCHDHFLNFEWSQRRFLGFASFFSEDDLEVIRCEVKMNEFVEPDFMFDNGEMNGEDLDSLENRLTAVTQLIVDPANPRFAASFVNRLWKRYLGLGLVEPVDDFREDIPPSHPELLEWLSYEFARSGYDIKHMMRLILNSRTYQLEFNPALVDIQIAGIDSERIFRSPTHRRLTCEQALDSIKVSLGIEAPRTAFDSVSTPLSRALGRPETRNEVITTRPEDVAVLQALQMLNGPELHEMIYNAALPRSLAETRNREAAVEVAFLSTLSRYPSESELELTLQFLGDNPGVTVWGDVLWALVVSPEFHYIA